MRGSVPGSASVYIDYMDGHVPSSLPCFITKSMTGFQVQLSRLEFCYLYPLVHTWFHTYYLFSRARILKPFMEAEKTTFRKELSFQRSENTTGIKQITFFVCIFQ
jgi:hypothetical protein